MGGEPPERNVMKPYYVELKIGAVVMADSEVEAMLEAESCSSDIVRDGDLICDSAVEVRSLEHLKGMDREWDGQCIPYGDGANDTRLEELLPEEDPVVDTNTGELFEV
jgi:hypothetical protein